MDERTDRHRRTDGRTDGQRDRHRRTDGRTDGRTDRDRQTQRELAGETAIFAICDSRVRWKIAGDLGFGAAEPEANFSIMRVGCTKLCMI